MNVEAFWPRYKNVYTLAAILVIAAVLLPQSYYCRSDILHNRRHSVTNNVPVFLCCYWHKDSNVLAQRDDLSHLLTEIKQIYISRRGPGF